MKHSIAKKIILRVSALLLLSLTILLTGTYLLVNEVVVTASEQYLQDMLLFYADVVRGDLPEDGVSLPELSQLLDHYGAEMCIDFEFDYIYAFIKNPKDHSLSYLTALKKDGDCAVKTATLGTSSNYSFTDENVQELETKNKVLFIETNDRFGHELSAVIRLEYAPEESVYLCLDTSLNDIEAKVSRVFHLSAAVILLVFIGVTVVMYLLIHKSVFRPAAIISSRMQDFITDGEHSTVRLPEDGDDEFAMISKAFNSMTDDIDAYLENIKSLNVERAYRETELAVAENIQKGLLPPEYYDGKDFEISAMMRPAKNIGGDLYDYLRIDDENTLVVIADVSGKGIAAAIFMAATLTFIRQFAKMNLSPAEILRNVNDALSEKNPRMLFVTAFLGVYNSRTHRLTYSNAGHNPPYLLRESLRALDDARGTPLGLFADEVYPQSEVTLKDGSTLFLYTDGVNEATDPQNKFFGIQRLEEKLAAFDPSRTDIVVYVDDQLKEFSAGAEQNDDTTILALTTKRITTLNLKADLHELLRIRKAILDSEISPHDQMPLVLAAEELFNNICSYAFENSDPEAVKICFKLTVSRYVCMQFEDNGIPYNPLETVIDAADYDLDAQIGGLGKLMAFSCVDDARYIYKNGKNILTLTKIRSEKE